MSPASYNFSLFRCQQKKLSVWNFTWWANCACLLMMWMDSSGESINNKKGAPFSVVVSDSSPLCVYIPVLKGVGRFHFDLLCGHRYKICARSAALWVVCWHLPSFYLTSQGNDECGHFFLFSHHQVFSIQHLKQRWERWKSFSVFSHETNQFFFILKLK